jgi:rubrerythrin
MNTTDTQAFPIDEIVVTEETLKSNSSRKAFLGTLMGGAAAAVALASTPSSSVFAATGKFKHAGAVPASDVAILQYALTLEHLETAFYAKAMMHFTSGYLGNLVKTLHTDEAQHVAGLTAALSGNGAKPVAKAPSYKFGAVFANRHSFLKFAAVLEDTGVKAYLGQAGLIKTPAILLTAASIVTVEARHTGAFRALLAMNPTDSAFDKGDTMAQVLAIAGPLIGK